MLYNNSNRKHKSIKFTSTIEIDRHYLNRKSNIDKELELLKNKK